MENYNNGLEKIKSESAKISREVKEKTFGFIVTAFGLVAGLAWSEAIQSLIKSFFRCYDHIGGFGYYLFSQIFW